jgi:hypothetical protein
VLRSRKRPPFPHCNGEGAKPFDDFPERMPSTGASPHYI